MPEWIRVSTAEEAARLLPPWFAARMLAAGEGGAFGLLLSTGEVLRAVRLEAAHVSAQGRQVLLDLALDAASVPEGADHAWRTKQFLGAPVPGRPARATVNLAHVVAVVEFGTAAEARPGTDSAEGATAGAPPPSEDTVERLKRAAEDAATGVASIPPDRRGGRTAAD